MVQTDFEPRAIPFAYVKHVAVTWPGEIYLAPDAMYDVIKKKGRWAPEQRVTLTGRSG